ncbi:hypothetical protein [Klebsiella pneumoniae]|uniref:hypothetical protein n=1 Tax=Klebsiella pneumoniae TaxID=573 RepID=UPI0039871620
MTTAPRACCVTLKRSWLDSRAEKMVQVYRRSGIQFLPFNPETLYRKLRALVEQHNVTRPELVSQAAHALLIPDYFSFRLTGNLNWEYTNATTTQLVNINSDSLLGCGIFGMRRC